MATVGFVIKYLPSTPGVKIPTPSTEVIEDRYAVCASCKDFHETLLMQAIIAADSLMEPQFTDDATALNVF